MAAGVAARTSQQRACTDPDAAQRLDSLHLTADILGLRSCPVQRTLQIACARASRRAARARSNVHQFSGFRHANGARDAIAGRWARVDSTARSWLECVVTDDCEALLRELRYARQAILDLMPDASARLLASYVQYPAEAHDEWLSRTVDSLVDTAAALPRPTAMSPSGVERVFCPLCRHGQQDPYAQGFAHPDGLRRHLMGSGAGRRCRVLDAAHALATEHWSGVQHSAPPRAAEPSNVAWRYQTGPECDGQLLSDHSSQPRSEHELAAAVHRLTQLGFVCLRTERSVVSYTRAIDGHVIYADPRAAGAIWFHCYHRRPGMTPRGWEQRFPSFKLRDSWNLAVFDKFEAWLAQLLSSRLSPMPGPVAPRIERDLSPITAVPVRRAAR
jgi:hypothetical protein